LDLLLLQGRCGDLLALNWHDRTDQPDNANNTISMAALMALLRVALAAELVSLRSTPTTGSKVSSAAKP
jgi:hypothetical protein